MPALCRQRQTVFPLFGIKGESLGTMLLSLAFRLSRARSLNEKGGEEGKPLINVGSRLLYDWRRDRTAFGRSY